MLAAELWLPLPGPQTEAYYSHADELFYGGAAGGGKSDLLLGIAYNEHRRSIVFRREYPQLLALIDRSKELFMRAGAYNGSEMIWRFPAEGKQIEFGAVQRPDDVQKYQGRPHDLLGFDEITHFTESQFRFLCGWLRTPFPGQRCRIIAAGNPPFNPEGQWIIRYWGPWLDKHHPKPAKAGELRWYAVIDGEDIEVDGPGTIEHKGEVISPRSRTFIPARIEDNPILLATGYRARLQAFPEPLRSMMLEGSFGVVQEDHPWQVIPTSWVEAAQARWKSRTKPDLPMHALGVDVARGGKDRTVLAPRYGNWFDFQKIFPGAETPDGQSVLRLVMNTIESGTIVNVDSIGVGTSVVDLGRQQGLNIVACNGAAGSQAKDRTGTFEFVNARAEWWWKFREALDPVSGEDIALPPDPELLSDLCAPRWELKSNGIKVESKEDIIPRIGRSPDKGDAAVYAHSQKTGSFAGLMGFYQTKAAEQIARRATTTAAEATPST